MKRLLKIALLIFVSNTGAQDWEELATVAGTTINLEDRFGNAVATSGNYAIIGAYFDDLDASGGSPIIDAGSAYVFENDGTGNWVLKQKLTAPARGKDNRFGNSIAISGNTALIGEYQEDSGSGPIEKIGVAHIFERDAVGNWNHKQKLMASDRHDNALFGYSVSISESYAVIGAVEEINDSAGANLVPAAGAVYVFEKDASGNWSEKQKLSGTNRAFNDWFGRSVVLSGEELVVGVYHENNDTASNNLSNDGAVYVYKRASSGRWNLTQKLISSDRQPKDEFGSAVAISGKYLVVAVHEEDHDQNGNDYKIFSGSVYVFEQDVSGKWNEVQKIVASDRESADWFGISVAISGETIVVGAFYQDPLQPGTNTKMTDAGAAYIYERDDTGEWGETQKIVASDMRSQDWFGGAVSISGDFIFVGADRKNAASTGGNISDAGGAYIFKRKEMVTVSIDKSPEKLGAYNLTLLSGSQRILLPFVSPMNGGKVLSIYSFNGKNRYNIPLTGAGLSADISHLNTGRYFVKYGNTAKTLLIRR